MPRPALAVLVALCVTPVVPAHAQEQPPITLTLERVIQDAQAANPLVRVARAGATEAAAGVGAAGAARFPRLTLSEGWQRGNQPIFVFGSLLASRRFAASDFAVDQLNHPDAIGAFHAAAAMEHVLFDGGARSAALAGAGARARMAESGVAEASQAVAVAAVDAYGQMLMAQSLKHATSAALEAGREDLRRATRRRDAGLATEADVLALAVLVADLEQRSIQLDGQIAIARAQINRLSGAAIGRMFEAVEPARTPMPALSALSDLFAEAESRRPELRRAAGAREAADASRRGARAAFLPRVAAQATVDLAGTSIADRASSWIVGGELRWSLPLAGAERAGLAAAAAAAARAAAELDDVRAQVQVDVLTAVERLRAANARQHVAEAAVAQARESQRIVRDRYEAGLAPVNDVLRSATAVLDADTQRVTAVVDALIAGAQLKRALGRE
ncbi:MAG: TolC family protein [Vicinamibacterales bacterium]